jgi:hypothetical protein
VQRKMVFCVNAAAHVQGVTVIEKRELQALNLHMHVAVIDLAPRLSRASHHDTFAERNVRQHLADLAGR